MNKPRLVYYNDAHHFHAKRIEPPASIYKLQHPVDEVAATGVDVLVLGLGYADVYFHNSKVGRVVGQKKEVWKNYIDWRIMRMVQEAHRMGTDQLREVIKRGRKVGVKVFPSLKLQDSAAPESERCGLLKLEHGADVCVGQSEERPWSYDFANELVRQDKLAILREVLVDYEADGIELDFIFGGAFFKQTEVERHTPLMNRFVGQIREMANEIGREQGREIPIMARVHDNNMDNLALGLHVDTWLKARHIDFVVAQVSAMLFETEKVDGWLADSANAVGATAYYRPPRRIYDERTIFPSVEMYRALSQTLKWQGFGGMYLGYLPWPFSDREYQILREVGYPEIHARRNKRYVLQPRELGGSYKPQPQRQLPHELEEEKTASFSILVADDLESAKKDGELRKPILTIRFSYFCIEDDVEIRLNGKVLPRDEAEIDDERGLQIPANYPGEVDAPLGFSAHWFRYKVNVDDIKRGENTLEIEVRKFAKTAGFTRSVNGVEIQTRYKDFVRPEGLKVDRMSPLSA